MLAVHHALTTEARAADARALVLEYLRLTQAEMTGDAAAELPGYLWDEHERLAGVYAPPSTFLVAYRAGVPVGCVGVLVRADRAEIRRLYVRPAARGGVGRVLMAHAHRHAAGAGVTTLALSVLRSRTVVTDFYRRLGYVDTQGGDDMSHDMVHLRRPVGCP